MTAKKSLIGFLFTFAAFVVWAGGAAGWGVAWKAKPFQPIACPMTAAAGECFGKEGGFTTLGRQAPDGKLTLAGIPFRLSGPAEAPRCLMTDLLASGSVSVRIGAPARVLYLLAATRAVAPMRESAFNGYCDDSYFLARIHYRDRVSEEVMPKVLPTGETLAADWKAGDDLGRAALTLHEEGGTTKSLFVYGIEPGRTAAIERVELIDRHDRFALALFAVTRDARPALAREPGRVKLAKPLAPEDLPVAAPSFKREGEALVGRCAGMTLTLDLAQGVALRAMTSPGRMGTMIETPAGAAPCPLFKIKVDETTLTARNFRVAEVKTEGNDRQSTAILSLRPHDEAIPVEVTLAFGLANPGTLRMRMSVAARRACQAWAAFPLIEDIALGGRAASNGYYFPIKGGVLHDRPADLYSRYLGGSAEVQFMDIFDRERGGGLTLRVEDNQDFGKAFELRKLEAHGAFKGHCMRYSTDYLPTFDRPSSEGLAMAVQYLPWKLGAGERLSLPETVLEAHGGDWREATRLYLNWVKGWYRADGRPEWVKRIYTLCGAVWVDFYLKNGEYGMPFLKDYVDMVCLYQWYLDSREKPEWFVGDYDFYPHDPEKLRAFLRRLEARGIRTSVYTEYYCLDDHSKIGETRGEAWTRRDAAGNYFAGIWKYNPCHALAEVQDYATSVTGRIMHGLEPDGVYFDLSSRSYADCYTAGHGHKTPGEGLRGTTEMFRKVHGAVRGMDPEAVIWSEETGTEPMSQHLDLAYSYALFYAIKEMPRELAPQGVNFYRFLFPDYKQVEIIGEDNEEGSRLAFFNGTGIFCRFMTPSLQGLWRRQREAFQRHAEAFTSREVEPLVPTLREGLYANGFYGRKEKVYTLFNANTRTVRGELMELPASEGAVYRDIFTGQAVRTERRGDKVVVLGEIGPREVTGVVAVK